MRRGDVAAFELCDFLYSLHQFHADRHLFTKLQHETGGQHGGICTSQRSIRRCAKIQKTLTIQTLLQPNRKKLYKNKKISNENNKYNF